MNIHHKIKPINLLDDNAVVSLRIPNATLKRLEDIAWSLRKRRSVVLREALEKFVASNEIGKED
jgi:predicted transcriptional regulator